MFKRILATTALAVALTPLAAGATTSNPYEELNQGQKRIACVRNLDLASTFSVNGGPEVQSLTSIQSTIRPGDSVRVRFVAPNDSVLNEETGLYEGISYGTETDLINLQACFPSVWVLYVHPYPMGPAHENSILHGHYIIENVLGDYVLKIPEDACGFQCDLAYGLPVLTPGQFGQGHRYGSRLVDKANGNEEEPCPIPPTTTIPSTLPDQTTTTVPDPSTTIPEETTTIPDPTTTIPESTSSTLGDSSTTIPVTTIVNSTTSTIAGTASAVTTDCNSDPTSPSGYRNRLGEWQARNECEISEQALQTLQRHPNTGSRTLATLAVGTLLVIAGGIVLLTLYSVTHYQKRT